jgi:peptidoglycan hydrolase CwlO-like protein
MSKTEKVEKLESKIIELEKKIYETRVKIESETHNLHKSTVKALGLV